MDRSTLNWREVANQSSRYRSIAHGLWRVAVSAQTIVVFVVCIYMLIGTPIARAQTCPTMYSPITNGTTADGFVVDCNFRLILQNPNVTGTSPSFTGNAGFNVTTAAASIDIANGNFALGTSPAMLIGADLGALTRTDSTRKVGLITAYPYANANRPFVSFLNDSGSGYNAVNLGGGGSGFNSATRVVFYTGATTNTPIGTERMRIDATGNVSIGSTGAGWTGTYGGRNLQIGNSALSDATGVTNMTTNAYNDGSWEYLATGTAQLYAQLASGWYWRDAISGSAGTNVGFHTEMALVSGSLGVGTAAPGQKLEVVGTIRQSGCTTAGTLSTNTSGDIICTSDARLKNILGPYNKGLDAINALQPALFRYKTSPTDPVENFIHAGFIAQNVKAAIPQAVALQKSGYYSLDTTAILAAAVNAIKVQSKEVSELKADKVQLDQEIATLRREQAREVSLLKTQSNEIAVLTSRRATGRSASAGASIEIKDVR